MGLIAIVMMAVVALGLVALAAMGIYLVRRSAPVFASPHVAADGAAAEALQRFRRRNRLWVLMLAVAFVVLGGSAADVPEWLALSWPLCVALLGVIVIAIWPQPGVIREPASRVRTADVQPRTMANTGPAWALIPPAVGAAILAVFLLVAGVAASPYGGRVIGLAAGATSEAGSTPFPGWPLGLPALIALLPLAGATVLALHRIAAYPAPSGPERRSLDAAIRRTATRQVMKVVTSAIFVSLGSGLGLGSSAVMNAAGELAAGASSVPVPGWEVMGTVMWAGGAAFTVVSLLLAVSLVIDAWFDPRLVPVPAAAAGEVGTP